MTGSKKIIVSLYACFHLLSIVTWNLPSSYLTQKITLASGPYMRFLGLWQAWNMFAPVPVTDNLYLTVRILYRDGTSFDYKFPRVSEMNYLLRYVKYRYAKWAYTVNPDDFHDYLPDAGLNVAKRFYTTPSNPPIRIDFYRFWAPVPPPEEGLGKSIVFNKYSSYLFYQMNISQDELAP